jgi:hypothetical protein
MHHPFASGRKARIQREEVNVSIQVGVEAKAQDDQDFILSLFDEGVIPQNEGGNNAVPECSFADEVVYETARR